MMKILIQCFFIHFFFAANIVVIMVFPYIIMLPLCLIGNLYIASMHFPVLCDQIDEITK